MKLTEVSIGPLARGDLKQKCRRIYNRLVVEDPEFQASADELQNVGLLALFVVVVLGSFYAVLRYAAPAAFEHLFPAEAATSLANVEEFLRDFAAPISIALTMLTLLGTYKQVSRWAFEVSGLGFITSAKSTYNRKKLLRMLDIVEGWLRTQPAKVCDAHNFLYKRKAGELLPSNLNEALIDLRRAESPDAVVIRGFAEKRYWPVYIFSMYRPLERDVIKGKRSYWREARGLRNAIRVNLVFDVLGVELRDEIPGGEKWRREYRTAYPRQHTALIDTEDLHLRFKTGAPYYRWPSVSQPSSEKETALYRMIMSLENPMRAPFHILAVDEVIAKFEPAVMELYPDLRGAEDAKVAERSRRVDQAIRILQRSDIYMYGKRSRQTLRPSADAGLDAQPILRNLTAGQTDEHGEPLAPYWQLRWDPNVVDWSSTVDPDGALFRALAILVQAVDMAGDEGTKVRLGRGDTIVFDNLRCLICRREWLEENITGGASLPANIWAWIKKVIGVPDRWWLRGYYGFRRSRPTRQAPGS